MSSLILTILYLAKDTINRWFTNISSPIARVLVVFFLTLCALFFLGSYVISTKLVRQQIEKQGADSVSLLLHDSADVSFPSEKKLQELLHVESYAIRSVAYASDSQLRGVPIYTYDFNRNHQIYPLLASGRVTLFFSDEKRISEGLRTIQIGNQNYTVTAKHLDASHPLMRLSRNACIIIPPDTAKRLFANASLHSTLYANMKLDGVPITVENLEKIESYITNYAELEGKQSNTISAIELLRNMDVLLGNQGQTRAIFCLGIAAIVGILLTSLSSMEFRQNEYVYTLLKSFGIHPLLLVFCFIIENIILVALSFIAAIACFMEAQKVLLSQFSQHGGVRLRLEEIMPEIELIGVALLLCVLFSAIPITLAANKEIGRVLK